LKQLLRTVEISSNARQQLIGRAVLPTSTELPDGIKLLSQADEIGHVISSE